MTTTHLVDLVDAHKHAYGVSDAELARRIGISRQNLNLWRTHGVRGLPARATLEGIATVIGRTYQSVLEAALRDAGYLDGPWTTSADHASPLSPACMGSWSG
ncbi:helix-turn-helix domain-containing protein [Gordonia paraffinivorans]|uniref:helix-turn-helix domain-containing protein n=2 Tax=Mycobacteriales TaxID=85007 RepID=UPI001FF8C6DF|nr:helix-turn-helix transcriptional regulator [Gordonia paraffinivorans]